MQEQKAQMQMQNNNKSESVQQINNNIKVIATDGKIDEEDLYQKLVRVQKRIKDENKDIEFLDAS